MFGGQARYNNITHARFENTTGQGIVLDNLQAIPEPSVALLAALGLLCAGAKTSLLAKSLCHAPPPHADGFSPVVPPRR
jgi:hypothetical protein